MCLGDRMGRKELDFLCSAILGQEVAQSQILHDYHPRAGAWQHAWPGEPDWRGVFGGGDEGCLPKMRNVWPRRSRNLALAWWPQNSETAHGLAGLGGSQTLVIATGWIRSTASSQDQPPTVLALCVFRVCLRNSNIVQKCRFIVINPIS